MLNLLGGPSDHLSAFAFVARLDLYGKAEARPGRKMGHHTLVAPSDAALPDPAEELDTHAPLTRAAPGFAHAQPLVGVIMGSDSDLPVMRAAAEILRRFAVPHELTIVSARRTPDRLVE